MFVSGYMVGGVLGLGLKFLFCHISTRPGLSLQGWPPFRVQTKKFSIIFIMRLQALDAGFPPSPDGRVTARWPDLSAIERRSVK